MRRNADAVLLVCWGGVTIIVAIMYAYLFIGCATLNELQRWDAPDAGGRVDVPFVGPKP